MIRQTLSHVKEAPYSADFGDFASFLSHMREQAVHRRKDLLVVDSGGKVGNKGFSGRVVIKLLHCSNNGSLLFLMDKRNQQICTMAMVFPTLQP